MVPSLVVAVSVASATLGAVLATGPLTLAQEAGVDGNTPSATSDPDAVRRPPTIEESFPSLSAVPSRPSPSVSVMERAAITSSLVSDRQNAQYTSEALRGGEEAAAPPPRALPPVAAEDITDPVAERRRVAEESGVTPFGSYSRRPDGAQVPPPLPSVPEAESYASAPPPNNGRGLASTVPGAVARPAAAPVETASVETPDPAAARPTGAVRPLRVPPTIASLPAPEGQEQRPVVAGAAPRVIASIDPTRAPVPSPASIAAARGTAPASVPSALVADASGSRYAPPAPATPSLRVAGGATPAVPPGAVGAPRPGPVQARGLVPAAPGSDIQLDVPVEVAPGVIVASVYQRQLAETRNPTSVPVSMPQFEVSSAPPLPVTSVPMTPAMRAALSGPGPAAPVRLDTPGRRADATPARTRATTAAAAAGSASGSGTRIGFAAGSIDLSPAARESIHRMASALQSGAAQVRIVGYARVNGDADDSVGAFGLSVDRANAVANALMAAGVPPQAVTVEAIVADAGSAAQRNRGKGPEAVVFVE
ncbi:MAG: OmpA family protein [Zavarzinia sp.]|nr:OmpA family protein [Zavarzinia sp.]